jgi:hypothetical protein
LSDVVAGVLVTSINIVQDAEHAEHTGSVRCRRSPKSGALSNSRESKAIHDGNPVQ